MRILAISDLHGDLASAWAAVETAQPDLLLSCGDWGDPDQITLPALQAFTDRLSVYTVFGNHDDLESLAGWANLDGSPVLLPTGDVQQVAAGADRITLAGVSGIWAKSNAKPYYVTDEQVDEAAIRIARASSQVDVLLSHGCPSGVADLTWQNRHAGQRCFLRLFQTVRPRVYLTGHLHRAQEHRTRDGQVIRNVGETPRGDATVILFEGDRCEVTSLTPE